MTVENITEESGVHKQWYEEARKQTEATLPEFIRHLTRDYKHDYGTICHAVAAAAIAAASTVDASPQGGITGFQSGCIMWQFVQEWLQMRRPLKLVDYEKMLFPQYAHDFEKTISKDVADWLVTQAKEKLKDTSFMAAGVARHLQRIVEGRLPFGYRVAAQ